MLGLVKETQRLNDLNARKAKEKGCSISQSSSDSSFTNRADVYGDANSTLVINSDKMKAAIARAEEWQHSESSGSGSGSGGRKWKKCHGDN